MRIIISLFCLLLVVCATLLQTSEAAHNVIEKISVRSYIFEPIRPKGEPEVFKECNSTVTKPYGQLEHVYHRGQEDDAVCYWYLRAPTNHRINFISLGFNISTEDDKKPYKFEELAKHSIVNIYFSDKPGAFASGFFEISPKQSAQPYVNSISPAENAVVEIVYRDDAYYDKQDIKIKYEFLPVDKITELLQNI